MSAADQEASDRNPSESPLTSVTRRLSAEEFRRLRAFAIASGVVIERDGLAVLGFGEALALPLPNGLNDLRRCERCLTLSPTLGPRSSRSAPFISSRRRRNLSVPAVCVRRLGDAAVGGKVVGTAPSDAAIEALLSRGGRTSRRAGRNTTRRIPALVPASS